MRLAGLMRMEVVFAVSLALSLLAVSPFGERVATWGAAVVLVLLNMLMVFLGLSVCTYVEDALRALRAAGFRINIRLQRDYIVGAELAFLSPLAALVAMFASVHFTWDSPLGAWLMRIGAAMLPASLAVQTLVFAGAYVLKRELKRTTGGTDV